MSTLGIATFSGEVKGKHRGGGGRSKDAKTLELEAAILKSFQSKKPMRWPGAAADGNYEKNANNLRRIGRTLLADEHPHGFTVHVGLEHQDLTFWSEPLVPRGATETEPEVAEETPKEKKVAKATPRKSTPRKTTAKAA